MLLLRSRFDLTYIAPGVGTQAGCGSSTPGSLCTPNGSPFTLLQLTSSTVVASLQLNGDAYTGSSASGESFTRGVFSTQTVIGGTLPAIIAALNHGHSIDGITYSASFAACLSGSGASFHAADGPRTRWRWLDRSPQEVRLISEPSSSGF